MKVANLYEYPVKGLRGNKICCAPVNKRGLAMDRRWMLVDQAGKFISQRQLALLARVQPSYHNDQLLLTCLPSGATLSVPFAAFSETLEVEVWGQRFAAHVAGREINDSLGRLLGRPVRLAYMSDDDQRPVKSSPANQVSFADGYPVLLTTRASLADLNERLTSPVPMTRFRANIVVDGQAPFAEDAWQRVQIGAVTFRVAKKCARCQVININQQTGEAGREPLRTLSTYRKEGHKVNFGINLIPENTGIIHEGDKVTVLA